MLNLNPALDSFNLHFGGSLLEDPAISRRALSGSLGDKVFNTDIGKTAWLFAKLQQAEPGRELTQPPAF